MTQSELLACDDYRALLRGICDEPQSDLPRLVLADWLDEHGHEARAEFVRDQVAGVRCAIPTLVAEQFGGYPNQYDHTLITDLRAGEIRYYCRRGFVWSVRASLWEFCRVAPSLFATSPIEHVVINHLHYERVANGGGPQEYAVRVGVGPFAIGCPLESLTERRFANPGRDVPRVVSDLCVEYGRAVAHLWRPAAPGIPARENPVG